VNNFFVALYIVMLLFCQ